MDPDVRKGMEKAGIAQASRHVFVCLGPDCCSKKEGEALWKMMKNRIKDAGLPVMRTKAGCFRICAGGPWIVVYPEGVWYGRMTPERFERILSEHLIGGTVVDEWVEAKNPLNGNGVTHE